MRAGAEMATEENRNRYWRRAISWFAFVYFPLAFLGTLAFLAANRSPHIWGQALLDHLAHLGEAAAFLFLVSLLVARFKNT